MYIKNTLLKIQEVAKQIDINDETYDIFTTMNIYHIFSEGIEDVRVQGRCYYDLYKIITLAFFAILHGFNNACEMNIYATVNKALLIKLGLLDGTEIPSHDTFRRVLTIIDPEELQEAATSAFADIVRKIDKNVHVSGEFELLEADGKTINGSGRSNSAAKSKTNISMLNIFNASSGLVIGCKAINRKTNEIPVAQYLLRSLKLKKTIVTADALHTQKETTKVIAERKGDYVLTLKTNQADLFFEANQAISQAINSSSNFRTVNDGKLTKTYKMASLNGEHYKDWVNIKKCVLFTKTNNKTGKEQKLMFITSLSNIDIVIEAISKRWEIENDLHRYKDLLLDEDSIRFTNKDLLNNLAILNNTALTFLKILQPIMDFPTLKSTRKIFMFKGIDILAHVLHFIESADILIDKFNKAVKA
jgi:predicted transposase YbfD/YdcC